MNTKEEFNKNYNLSYVDETLPKPDNRVIAKHLVSSLIVYLLVYIILASCPFFKNYFPETFKHIYISCLFAYMLIAPVIYFVFRPKSVYYSHNVHICNYLYRCITGIKNLKPVHSFEEAKQNFAVFKPDYYEKSSLILIFIKFFFGALMFTGATNDVNTLKSRGAEYSNLYSAMKYAIMSTGLEGFNNVFMQWRDFIYHNLVLVLYTIDLVVFSVGYLTEFYLLRNKIRTVETTIGGLFFCLICYPPLVSCTSALLGWNSYDNAAAFGDQNHPVTWTIRIIALFFIFTYVAASVALGTKASNLTNRGTVSVFPYNIVRHPAYISKCTFWFLQLLLGLIVPASVIIQNPGQYISAVVLSLVSFSAYVFIYYMRALTEERHLMLDPDYREYQKKVKWQFIPGIF